jgi:hypothetical protein
MKKGRMDVEGRIWVLEKQKIKGQLEKINILRREILINIWP